MLNEETGKKFVLLYFFFKFSLVTKTCLLSLSVLSADALWEVWLSSLGTWSCEETGRRGRWRFGGVLVMLPLRPASRDPAQTVTRVSLDDACVFVCVCVDPDWKAIGRARLCARSVHQSQLWQFLLFSFQEERLLRKQLGLHEGRARFQLGDLGGDKRRTVSWSGKKVSY